MVIDKVLDAITDVEIALEQNDEKAPRSDKGIRAKRDEGIRLTTQLSALSKQLEAFGTRGQEWQKLRNDKADAHFIVWMGVHDPDRLAAARVFLERHDPTLLHKLETETRDNEYQQMRLKLILYMTKNAPEAVAAEMVHRFFDSIEDPETGDLPAWVERRFPRKASDHGTVIDS